MVLRRLVQQAGHRALALSDLALQQAAPCLLAFEPALQQTGPLLGLAQLLLQQRLCRCRLPGNSLSFIRPAPGSLLLSPEAFLSLSGPDPGRFFSFSDLFLSLSDPVPGGLFSFFDDALRLCPRLLYLSFRAVPDIADPPSGIRLRLLQFLGHLPLGRARFLQLPGHQDRPVFLLQQLLLHPADLRLVLLTGGPELPGELALPAGSALLCLAKLRPKLVLGRPAHLHGPVDAVLQLQLLGLPVMIEEIEADRPVLVLHTADFQFHPQRLPVRPPQTVDPAGGPGRPGRPLARLPRFEQIRGQQTAARNAGHLQTEKGIRDDISAVGAVGNTEKRGNIPAHINDTGGGPALLPQILFPVIFPLKVRLPDIILPIIRLLQIRLRIIFFLKV